MPPQANDEQSTEAQPLTDNVCHHTADYGLSNHVRRPEYSISA
jgi:hypothetical protein